MSNEEEKINDAAAPEDIEANAAAESDAEEAGKADDAEEKAPEAASSDTDGAENDADTEKSGDKRDDEKDSDDAEADIEDSKTAPDNKSKAARSAVNKKSAAMNTMFKRIYFPLVAVLIVIMSVFSIIDAFFGYGNKAYDDGYYTAVNALMKDIGAIDRSDLTSSDVSSVADKIVDALKAGSFFEAEQEKDEGDPDSKEDEDLYTTTDWSRMSNIPVPTVTKLVDTPTTKLQLNHSIPVISAGKEFTDVIAAIPSGATRTGKQSSSVIITVRYDSRADSNEAALLGFVSSAVEALISYVKSGDMPQNDIVVVFTEDMEYAYGTYLFVDMFDGFGDIVSRAKAAVNLEAYGNGGTLAVTDATNAGLSYFNAYTSMSGTTFNSSIAVDAIPAEMKNTAAVDAFASAGIPVVQIAVLGDINNAQSSADSVAGLSQSTLYAQSSFIKNYFEKMGDTDKTFDVNDNTLVFFSYFDWGTVAYDHIAAYVIAAITLAVIIAAIALTVLKKTFSLYRMLVAVGVQFLVFVSAIAAMYAAYFLVTLMLTGFGVIPINAITQLRFFNAGILIASLLIAFASAFGFTTVYKKVFKVTSSDTVRGNAILVAVIAVIFGFAAPAYSYVVAWLGLLMASVLLATVLLNKKFKARFGYGMDRLFPFVLPVLITLPITMSTVASLASLWPLYLLPIVMLLFVAMLGSAVPYLDRSVTFFDKIAKKLPMRTQRVERTVTERVEDRAKKGKFTERTVRRVEKEKVPVNYKNYFGISLVTVIAIVTALLSGGFGASFGQSITVPYAYNSSVYNDSIVYEWNRTSGGTVSQQIVIGDLITYKYARYAIDGLEWDSSREMYVMPVNYDSATIISNEPSITRDGDDNYNVSTFDGPRSIVTLTIPSAKSISRITVTNDRGLDYVYRFNNNETIVMRLPYGFGNFTMIFEGTRPSVIKYEERSEFLLSGRSSEHNPLANVDEWNMLRQYYQGTDLETTIRGGIVLKATFSI